MTCITLPKLPFPTTLRSSKSSMDSRSWRFSTKFTPIFIEPEPNWILIQSAPIWPWPASFFAFTSPACVSSNLGVTVHLPMKMSSVRPVFGGADGFRM